MSLRANCISHWKMNDDAANKTVVDSSGNGNDGEAQQNTEDLHTDGKINGALTFNGVDDYIRAAILACITKNGTYSFSVWFYLDSTGDNYEIFQNAPATNDRNCMVVWNSVLTFGYYNGISWSGKSKAVDVGEWVHAVGINNNGSLTLYINSVLQIGTYNPYCSFDPDYIFIGKHTISNFFDGKMDCVMIFDKALSEEEVAFLWNEGNGREYLGTARPLVGGSLATGRKGLV